MRRTTIHFDRPKRHWLAWIGAALAAVAVIGVVLLLRDRRSESPPMTARVASAPVPAAARKASPVASFASNPNRPPPATVTAAAADPCEASVAPPSGWDEAKVQAREMLRFRSAREDAQKMLRARADELSQAVAHLLTAASDDFSARASGQQDLARLAQGSSDPRVWAIAYPACHGHPIGNCQLLSAERWVQLDPGNGTPWYYIAMAALRRGDGPAADEAMKRLAEAPRIDLGDWSALQPVTDLDPADPVAVTEALRLSTTMISARWTHLPPMSPILEYCFGRDRREGTPVIAARAATCGRVAEALGTRASTMLERSIGARLAARFDLPIATRLRDEVDAVRTFTSEAMPSDLSCAGMKRQIRYVQAALRWGELPAILQAIEASDMPLDKRMERERERRQQGAAAAASAPASAVRH